MRYSAVLLVLILGSFLTDAPHETKAKIGSQAAPLTLKQVLQAPDGIGGTLDELKGRAIVLAFPVPARAVCLDY
jgi:hypothetical protein